MKKDRKKIIIDYMQDEDNQAVLDLSHRCIQHGTMSVYPDRTPAFNRIHKELDDRTFHMVARSNGDIVGCIGGIHTPVQHGGKVYDSIYMLDFKVDPDYQKGMTAYRLAMDSFNKTIGSGEEIGFATIIKGNEASHIFTRGRAGFPGSTNLGDIRVNNLIPIKKKKLNKSYSIEKPGEKDIKELIQLYGDFYKKYKLAPHLTEELFKYYIDTIEGIDLDNMWVARKNGKIKAVLCAWDEDVYKRWMVMKIPRHMRFIFWLIRILSVFLKLPAPVRTGKPLRQKTLVMVAHDDDLEALKNLIKHVNNIHRGTEYTVIQSHFHRDDEMCTTLDGFLNMSVDIEVHMLTSDPKLAESIAKEPGPVLFEWPMYI